MKQKIKKLTLPREFNLTKTKSIPQRSPLPIKQLLKRNLNNLTVPQSPFLQTKQRGSKPSTLISTQDKDYNEYLENQQPFIANPIPTVKPIKQIQLLQKQLTIPVSPRLSKRIQQRTITSNSNSLSRKQPVVGGISKQTKQTKQKSRPLLKLPTFKTTHKPPSTIYNPFAPSTTTTHNGFKAKTLNTHPDSMPEIQHKEPTHPIEFELLTKQRGQLYQDYLDDKLELEEYQEFKQREFKAGPMWDGVFHETLASQKEPTEPIAFNLLLDKRGEERRAFDNDLKKREEESEEMRIELEEKEKMRIDGEIMRERRERVHNAQKMPMSRVMRIKASEKVLTMPVSPMINKRKKQRDEKRKGNGNVKERK